jgi:TfoX/Sxy family transcriptional regulator of competence genes
MGFVERAIRDRAAESLMEIPDLDVRAMFSGFGFYIDGLLVAAAWDGAFRLRYRQHDHWRYKAVDDATVDDPRLLVPLVLARAEQLTRDPDARRRR